MVQDEPAATLPMQPLVWAKGALAVTLVTCIGPVPMFCKVTFLAALVVPRTCDEKVSVAGVTEASGAVPVPVKTRDCDAPALPESSLMVTDPVTGPVVVGENVTVTVQLVPATSWLGQALVWLKGPLVENPERLSGLPPKLVMVTSCDELPPTFCEKSKTIGANLMAEGSGEGTGTGVTPKT